MARGWESKSVESQMEDRHEPVTRRESFTPEERERRSKQESLEMSRRRIQRELESARSETHRTALQHALHHLDDELSRFR
jgi:hypothetical protein